VEPLFVIAKILGLPGSSAVNNFVRKGPVNDVISYDVISHWRRLETESDCYFR